MKKTIVIHQPDFLPYLGFFHRLIHADTFVIFDNAQYVNGTSHSWMNRDKLKTSQGEKWLTVSVKKAARETLINQIVLSENAEWRNLISTLFIIITSSHRTSKRYILT